MRFVKTAAQLVLLLCVAMASTAYARAPVPIINHDNVPISTPTGKEPTLEQVRQAFVVGGGRKGWTFKDAGENQMVGEYVRRNHHIRVTVTFTQKSYSVDYKDSVNMKYRVKHDIPVKDGSTGAYKVMRRVAMIHPYYNRWVDALIREVDVELSKIQ